MSRPKGIELDMPSGPVKPSDHGSNASEGIAGRVSWVTEKFVIPIFIVVLSAVVGGLLLPTITSSWQNHQKQLDIQTKLVTTLSDDVTRDLVTLQIDEVRGNTTLDSSLKQWLIDSGDIGAQLQAYFPQTRLRARWDTYSGAVEAFYEVGNCQSPVRSHYLTTVERYFANDARINQLWVGWRVLGSECTYPIQGNSPYEYDWLDVQSSFMHERDVFTAQILKTSVATY
jgi:hypothetical protein